MSTSRAAKTVKDAKEAVVDETDTAALSAELKELRREFRELVEQVGRVGKVSAHEAKSAAKSTVRHGKEASDHIVEEVADYWSGLEGKVVKETRESPWKALGLAAAAGVALGFILRR